MFEQVDWSERAAHMWERALADPDRLVITPDYNSRSGETSRVIGYSPSRGELLSVIVHTATGYGVNGWPSNTKDHRLYREGGAS